LKRSVWAIWGSGQEWLAKGFMLLLFGIPVFVWMKWRQQAVPHRLSGPDCNALALQVLNNPPPTPASLPHEDVQPKVPVGAGTH
jgi:hypothetical protein